MGLKLFLAGLKDGGTDLIKATYDLEGEQLEILVAHRVIEYLRGKGNALRRLRDDIDTARAASHLVAVNQSLLPTVASIVKDIMKDDKPRVGTRFVKRFDDDGRYLATVKSIDTESGTNKVLYCCEYEDGDKEDLYIEELQAGCMEYTHERYVEVLDFLLGAYDYLESRLTDDCDTPYHCGATYEVFR